MERVHETFRKVFSPARLEAWAGPAGFEVGRRYALGGLVQLESVAPSSVTATVETADNYHVALSVVSTAGRAKGAYDCTCRRTGDGSFCRHAVAVALIATGAVTGRSPAPSSLEAVDLAAYLATLEPEQLVALLMDRAAADKAFGTQLRLAAACTTVERSGAPVSAQVFSEAIAALHQLLKDGHGAEAVALAQATINQANQVVGLVDDNDGFLSRLSEQLADLHLRACDLAQIDPVELAHMLFTNELGSDDLEVFYGAAARYADVLQDEGLAEYRRLAQQVWATVPKLEPGSADRWDSGRYRITRIMETLAQMTGDVDQVVEVLSHDQSSPYQFVRMARVLADAGRYDDALAWAEQGLSLHGYGDARLVEVTADEYHRRGHSSHAVRLVWEAFVAAPSLATYQMLAGHAERAGLWPTWHERALDHMRERIAAGSGPHGFGNTTLVEALMFDGDNEAAWEAAQAGGCRDTVLAQLTRLRKTTRRTSARAGIS